MAAFAAIFFDIVPIDIGMSIVVPLIGGRSLLDKMIKLSDEDFKLKLYKNNYTPGLDSILVDFVEADFGGYEEKILIREDWEDATSTVDLSCNIEESVSIYSEDCEWNCVGYSGNVYGLYIIGKDSGYLLWSERFLESPQTVNVGDILTITPRITLRTQIPC